MKFKDVVMSTAVAVMFFGLAGAAKAPKPELTPSQQIAKVARAVLLYVDDNDGCFPFASSHGPAGIAPLVANISVPYGWSRSIASARGYADALACVNSTLPYLESTALLAIDGAPEKRFSKWSYDDAIKQPVPTSLTFNGLLNLYPRSGVAAPSVVPLVWTGAGHVSRLGYASASPVLHCWDADFPRPCRFDPASQFQMATTSPAEGEAMAFGEGILIARIDGSVKTVRPNSGASDSWKSDPFATYGPGNVPGDGWSDGRYSILFRPDRQD